MHLESIRPKHLAQFPELEAACTSHTLTRLVHTVLHNPGFALLDGERLIGAGGIVCLWPGVGEAWMLTTPLASTHFTRGFVILRQMLHRLQDDLGLWRVQAIVLPTSAAARLTRLLGFKPEGKLVSYRQHGEDCYMAARVIPQDGP